MSIGSRLKYLREKNKLSRESLSQKLGISYWALSKYETDGRTPDPDTINKFADFFGVSTDYILGRIDNPEIENVKPTNIPTANKEVNPDIKAVLNHERAHWNGKPLTPKQREIALEILKTVLERIESGETVEDDEPDNERRKKNVKSTK